MISEGSLRLKSKQKIPEGGKPLVSIITATFNAAKYLPHTIDSVRALEYENVEWIVVDGDSSDDTVNLIRQNEDVIDYWKSEPDSGIYDAWNKGISMAHGEWLAFLGAGDSYMPDAICAYISAIAKSPTKLDLASSRVRFVNNAGESLRIMGAPFNPKLFRKYMTIAHAGALHRRSLFEQYGLFDTSYLSAGDYEFLMRCGASLQTIYLDVVTVDMPVGGISNGYTGLFETYLVQKRYGVGLIAFPRYLWSRMKSFVRPFLRGY